jgi:hypothetical protein
MPPLSIPLISHTLDRIRPVPQPPHPSFFYPTAFSVAASVHLLPPSATLSSAVAMIAWMLFGRLPKGTAAASGADQRFLRSRGIRLCMCSRTRSSSERERRIRCPCRSTSSSGLGKDDPATTTICLSGFSPPSCCDRHQHGRLY